MTRPRSLMRRAAPFPTPPREWVSGRRRYLNMEDLALLAEREAPGVKREEGKVALMRR